MANQEEQIKGLMETVGDLSLQLMNLAADFDVQKEALTAANQRLEASTGETANQRRLLEQAGARLEESQHIQREQNVILEQQKNELLRQRDSQQSLNQITEAVVKSGAENLQVLREEVSSTSRRQRRGRTWSTFAE